jgi:hypothetical protein
MHDDPTKTIHKPTSALTTWERFQSPCSGATPDRSSQGGETPDSDPGERAFAVGMVCFALAGLVLMVLRSDWWGA